MNIHNEGNRSMKTVRKIMATVSVVALVASTATASAQSMDELIAAAKKEGTLTTIALPHDWCGYGAIIEAFKAKFEPDHWDPVYAIANERPFRPTTLYAVAAAFGGGSPAALIARALAKAIRTEAQWLLSRARG